MTMSSGNDIVDEEISHKNTRNEKREVRYLCGERERVSKETEQPCPILQPLSASERLIVLTECIHRLLE